MLADPMIAIRSSTTIILECTYTWQGGWGQPGCRLHNGWEGNRTHLLRDTCSGRPHAPVGPQAEEHDVPGAHECNGVRDASGAARRQTAARSQHSAPRTWWDLRCPLPAASQTASLCPCAEVGRRERRHAGQYARSREWSGARHRLLTCRWSTSASTPPGAVTGRCRWPARPQSTAAGA